VHGGVGGVHVDREALFHGGVASAHEGCKALDEGLFCALFEGWDGAPAQLVGSGLQVLVVEVAGDYVGVEGEGF
jgi:hypothetical protein